MLLAHVLLSSALLAADPGSAPTPAALVEQDFLRPLARRERERARFSRAAPLPAERKVRVLASAVDAAGKEFVAFAIDERRGGAWQKTAMKGCLYAVEGRLFVERGGKLRAAEAYLGRQAEEPPASACAPTTPGA